MSLRKKIGSMLLFGFQGKNPSDTSIIKFCEEVNQYNIKTTILFSYNIDNPKQLKELTFYLKSNCNDIKIAIDQEGGNVERLTATKGFLHTDSAYNIANKLTPAEAYQKYLIMAKMLADLNININFAPCVDLDSNTPCPVIGGLERSYSTNPHTVVNYAKEFIDAHKEYKIMSCLKHFPGHGYAKEDSHYGLTDTTNCANIEQEIIPYKELLNHPAKPSVMTAHIVNQHYDSSNLPATLSKEIINNLLRKNLNFNGLIFTDDLMMAAIRKYYSLKDVLVNTINAGCDILMFSRNIASSINSQNYDDSWDITPNKIIDTIQEAVEQGLIAESRIEESYNRIMNLL